MELKKTLVVGASPNPERYSYKAVTLLHKLGFPVEALGIRQGNINGITIRTGMPNFTDIHTISLYIGAEIQEGLYDYLIGLRPERIIFNPGTENEEFEKMASEEKIEVIEACTLVMLNKGNF